MESSSTASSHSFLNACLEVTKHAEQADGLQLEVDHLQADNQLLCSRIAELEAVNSGEVGLKAGIVYLRSLANREVASKQNTDSSTPPTLSDVDMTHATDVQSTRRDLRRKVGEMLKLVFHDHLLIAPILEAFWAGLQDLGCGVLGCMPGFFILFFYYFIQILRARLKRYI